MNISTKDKIILRELAKKQFEYANSPINKERIIEWYEHNDLKGKRPMIHLEMGAFYNEIIPPRLSCESDSARGIEARLYSNFVNHELFNDDYPVPDFFPVYWDAFIKLFGIDIEIEYVKDESGNNTIAHRYKYVVDDLKKDIYKFKKTEYGVQRDRVLEYKATLEELFGDILPVKIVSASPPACPTYDLVMLMGMENMYFSMYDYPDEFHEVMERITNDYIEFFKWQEKEGLILPTNGNNIVHWGTWGFTHELSGTKDGEPCTLKETWGYMNSQESVGLSPDMYHEFIFPYYKKIADLFGLFAYGCCEAVHPFWEKSLSSLLNLRKLSISHWADENYMGEQLKHSKVIYQRKPFPNYISTRGSFDESGFTADIINTLKAAKDCKLEFIIRDICTVNNDIERARRVVEIIREQIGKLW